MGRHHIKTFASSGFCTIRRRTKICIVVTASVLCIGKNKIITLTSSAQIILLKIAGWFIKAILVREIVHDVIPIKQIGNCKTLVDRIAGCFTKIRSIIKVKIVFVYSAFCAFACTVITISIFLRQNIIATGIFILP